jgi:hypothetical protein
MTSPNATRPNLLLMLADHLHAEIAATEQEIAALEHKINEARDHLHTLRDVRAAAKLEPEPTPEVPA